jgi:multidrug efflux pump subunit AcrA (membrane-fusion protein)
MVAQNTNQDSLSRQVQKLTEALANTQAQLELSQRELDEMQKQLKALQQQMAQNSSADAAPTSPVSNSYAAAAQDQTTDLQAAVQDIRDRQAMQESQIATQEQTKIESESKYPVKITGFVLMSGFINTRAVDQAATPTLALRGPGSTGASIRQTVLGFDARGPHLFGANSYADLRVDLDGRSQSTAGTSTYSGLYTSNATLLRLRTAHAGLQWKHTDAYFSLDHPIFNPDTPTSLTAIAEPALAWSGNVWTWNPQIGVRQEVPMSSSRAIELEAALIDVGDAPLSPPIATIGAPTGTSPSSAEQSRWPGVEGHLALVGAGLDAENRNHFGLGGYFAPHHAPIGEGFDAWAGTLDAQFLLPAHLKVTGSAYRGLALGGLGGGAFKDVEYRTDPATGNYYIYPLDDVGGWAQLKGKINERVELNGAFGIDDAFASEVRRYSAAAGTLYQNLSISRTYTGNVIYRPSAYLLFSLEYRHLESSPVLNPSAESNVIGLGAGFKF